MDGRNRLKHSQTIRFSREQWCGLKRAEAMFRVTGRQKAQRQINQLFMAFFGLINDPLSSATMRAMIADKDMRTALADPPPDGFAR